MATPTIPRNADELTDALGNTSTLRDIVKTPEALRDFIVDYAKGQAAKDPGIEAQIREETERQWAEILRNDKLLGQINRLNLDPTASAVPRSKNYNPKAPGAKLDAKFASWVDYLTATWDGARTPEAFAAKAEIKQIQNAFGSSVPSDGGFLIPEYLRSELLRVPLEQSVVRQRARVVPMETLSVPYPTIDSTSNASTVYGGITGYWTEEGGTLTDSSPTFGRVNLIAKKLTLYSEIPNELFQDSLISLQQFMSEAYPEALTWFEDVSFISGTGVGEPLGFLNADAAVAVAKETGQDADTITWDNIVKMYARLLPSSMNRAVWIANNDTFPQLATMALSVGTGGSAVWIGDGGGEAAPPMRILGRPVIFTEKVPTVGDAGDINLVDMGYYLIGDRQAMQMSTSTEFRFNTDKTAMRLIERVDGQPWLQSAITPRQGTNTLSPFVKIAARA